MSDQGGRQGAPKGSISFSIKRPATTKPAPLSLFAAADEPRPVAPPRPKTERWRPPAGHLAPAPAPAPAPRYPRGFSSEAQFRDVTRPVARAYRDAHIGVRGSSVTGRSFNSPDREFGGRSDIDLFIVSRPLHRSDQVNERGFPSRDSQLEKVSDRFGEGVAELRPRAKRSGIKVFPEFPGGQHIERPHTPEAERRDEHEGRGEKRGRRSSPSPSPSPPPLRSSTAPRGHDDGDERDVKRKRKSEASRPVHDERSDHRGGRSHAPSSTSGSESRGRR